MRVGKWERTVWEKEREEWKMGLNTVTKRERRVENWSEQCDNKEKLVRKMERIVSKNKRNW